MLRILRTFSTGLLFILAFSLTIGCGSGAGGKAKPKRIIFLNNTDSPFWDACRAGLTEGEKLYKLKEAGYEISWQSNDGTEGGQIEKLRQFGTQGDVAAVAISVLKAENEAIMAEMKKLQEKGIHVIAVDADVNAKKFPDARKYYIGTDNLVAGRQLGISVKALLESKDVKSGGYVQFVGFTDNDNAKLRMDGAKEALGEAYSELDRMPDEVDRSRAQSNVSTAITNHADKLSALLGIWSYNAPAIVTVVKQKNVRSKYVIGTFDAEQGAIVAMEEGQIDVMVVQDPYAMGKETARLLFAMSTKDSKTVGEMFPNEGKAGGDVYTTPLRVIVPDENSPVKKEMFDSKIVEFMTLSQFKEWLKKYNLTAS